MARRKIVAKPKAAPPCAVKSLVMVANQDRIRRNFLKKYRQRVKILQVDSERLRHYREIDAPAFSQWQDSEFGPLRSQLSELLQEIGPLSYLVRLIEDYACVMNVTDYKAYRVVMKAKEKNQLDEIERVIIDAETAWENAEMEQEEPEISHEAHEDFFQFTQETIETPCPPKILTHSPLRTLYRQLVRKLHPDYLSNPSSEQVALWHEVQNAYSWEDLERLEAIHKSLDSSAQPSTCYETMPLSEILNLQLGVEKRLEGIRTEIKNVKKNVDWNFTTVKTDSKKLRQLVRDMQYSYEVEIAKARKTLRFFTEHLAKCNKNPRAKTRAHNRTQASPSTIFDAFFNEMSVFEDLFD